jgi:hypothetical protein
MLVSVGKQLTLVDADDNITLFDADENSPLTNNAKSDRDTIPDCTPDPDHHHNTIPDHTPSPGHHNIEPVTISDRTIDLAITMSINQLYLDPQNVNLAEYLSHQTQRFNQ